MAHHTRNFASGIGWMTVPAFSQKSPRHAMSMDMKLKTNLQPANKNSTG